MSIETLDLRELADELDTLNETYLAGELDDEGRERLETLLKLQDELGEDIRTVGEDYEPTMIRESDFTEYAQELAEDVGAVPADLVWPMYCIDWERAARELRYDYTSVTFDGTDYLIRSW